MKDRRYCVFEEEHEKQARKKNLRKSLFIRKSAPNFKKGSSSLLWGGWEAAQGQKLSLVLGGVVKKESSRKRREKKGVSEGLRLKGDEGLLPCGLILYSQGN